MTSRERVLAAINHRTADRVPVDVGGTEVTGLHGIAYARLKSWLGMETGPARLFHVYMQLAAVEEPVRARFRGDVVRLSIGAREWKPWPLADGTVCEVPAKWSPRRGDDGSEVVDGPDGKPLIVRHRDSPWFSPVGPVCPYIQSLDDVRKYGQVIRFMDRAPWFDETLEEVAARAKQLRVETDYALAGVFGGHIFAAAQLIRGMENFMCDLAVDEAFAGGLMDALTEAHMEDFERYIAALGPHLDVICIADDLGMQQGPQLDPAMWRRLVKPRMARLYGFMKSRMGGIKLFLHSCGSVRAFIPDLIEMGVDILNPVQVAAAGMDSRELKAAFGRDIVFWGGGCDTQRVLPLGTPAEVRAEVARRMEDFAPDGGYVFAQVHNVQPDVAPENMAAMWDAAVELGKY